MPIYERIDGVDELVSSMAYRFEQLELVQCPLTFFTIDETHLTELRRDENCFTLREIHSRVRGGGVRIGGWTRRSVRSHLSKNAQLNNGEETPFDLLQFWTCFRT